MGGWMMKRSAWPSIVVATVLLSLVEAAWVRGAVAAALCAGGDGDAGIRATVPWSSTRGPAAGQSLAGALATASAIATAAPRSTTGRLEPIGGFGPRSGDGRAGREAQACAAGIR